MNTTPNPNGCAYCGEDKQTHVMTFHEDARFHNWVEPTNQQRLERMRILYKK